MGIVSDGAQLAFHAINGIQQIQNPKEPGRDRNRDKKQIKPHMRHEHDGRIKYPHHRPARPYGTVKRLVLVSFKRKPIAGKKTHGVDQDKIQWSYPPKHYISKKVQGEHVKKQMGHIHVQKGRTQQSNTLTPINGSHLKFITLKKIAVVKSFKGHQNICSDKGQNYWAH